MDERAALKRIAATLPAAGDDAAVVDGQVITTDMLHERTDFPAGTTRYTAGWRAVGASLSDVAGMGARATVAVSAYAAPSFDEVELEAYLDGARDVCDAVGAEYVGGDLDTHSEFTVATTALGETDTPVLRSGAKPGDVVAVTGGLGRSAAALRLFEQGELDRANDLFQFTPRVAAGVALAPHASAMMDISDGVARSLHQLAEASDCGFAVEEAAIPVVDAVGELAADATDRRELSLFFGEDFELLVTIPEAAWEGAVSACPDPLTRIGAVTDGGIEMDDNSLPDRGYTHGN
ncbi:thiamine-phosphate kinase [Haladaptatus sp. DJG-WS-42]|uniref:thiamine-phosphate kinase n=1 Tax=Haladaptatus sp. DJG-WS-42 TaxID=3120516 RepID=UPI0030CCE657